MSKILFVANVAKEHMIKFHVPTILEFKKHGWTVDVACAGEDKVPGCDRQFVMEWKRSPFSPKTLTGERHLKRIIAEGNYDVVYCHTPVGGLEGRLAARRFRKRGTKVVYCAHGLHFYKGAPLVNRTVYYSVEKFLARYTDIFMTVNDEDFGLVSTRFNRRMKTVRIPGIGVDFSRLDISDKESVREKYRKELDIPDDATALIYVAELNENKNQTMLIDVLKKLRDDGREVRLILVGPDYSDGRVEEYAEKLGVEDFVRFTGWRRDVGELMAAADICVASSVREGFGINIVEAMYCGLPVVASRNRGHVTIIKDGVNGFLVEPDDGAGMAKRVEDIMDDRELYARLSAIDVSEYDATVIAASIYDLIAGACGNGL